MALRGFALREGVPSGAPSVLWGIPHSPAGLPTHTAPGIAEQDQALEGASLALGLQTYAARGRATQGPLVEVVMSDPLIDSVLIWGTVAFLVVMPLFIGGMVWRAMKSPPPKD